MYESDEWYIQDTNYKKDRYVKNLNTVRNAQSKQQHVVSEAGWDLNASASDNESFDIETDG